MAILNFAYALNAAADFSTAGQYRFVTIDASGDAALSSAGGDSEGVLQNNPVAGASGNIWRGGISKVQAGGVIAIGDNIASDAVGRGVVAVAGDSILGVAKAAAGAVGNFFDMVQTDRSDTGNGALSNVLADPGNAGALLVGGNGQTPIVTGGAETRTMADATFAGQLRLLYLKTDGGDCVITFASPIDQLGTLTYTFDDVGEMLLLVAVEDGADIEWRIAGQDNGHGVIEQSVADPGDATAIPVGSHANIPITTGAGGETNTCAIPSFLGQRITFTFDVDGGGDRVITFASAINVAGNTIATFATARQTLVVQGIQLAGVLAWEVVINNGTVVLS